jgi:hypothetical protein
LACLGGWAREGTAQAKLDSAQIDTRLANETIEALISGDAEVKQRTIAQIKDHSENFAPPVFYVLSAVLFELGDKDEAAFWFYAGQLRARFDANRCADLSARQAITILNERFRPAINRHAFQDIPKLKALIPRVVEWDRRTPHLYDHRWINLHGMNAIVRTQGKKSAATVFSAPREEWQRIAEKTREDYLSGFEEAMARLERPQR